MLLKKNPPYVFWDDDTNFKDLSFYMLSYGRDSYNIPLIAADDYVYFGRVKPFNSIYIEMATANTVATTLDVEYYNGSSWVNLSGVLDDTLALKRSGFLTFNQPSDWASATVNSQDAFFIRFTPLANVSATTSLQGMNIVFSDDEDLKGIYPGVINYKISQEKTFILRHEAVRDDIVQSIRNDGHSKLTSSGSVDNIEAWDFLQSQEVRRWSVYLVLANIFSSLQSTEDGLYKQKADEYLQKASEAKDLFYLSLDKDDDGILDEEEKTASVTQSAFFRR